METGVIGVTEGLLEICTHIYIYTYCSCAESLEFSGRVGGLMECRRPWQLRSISQHLGL